MAGIREEIFGPAVSRASPAFDPVSILARLVGEGWTLLPDGPSRVKKAKCRESACEWERLPSDLLKRIYAHKHDLEAYVLTQAKGVSNGPT